MSQNIRALSARSYRERTLFEALLEMARTTGTPSHAQLRVLGEQRQVSPAALLGAASFYDFLSEDNRNKQAYVCKGTACLLAGGQEAVRARLGAQFSDEQIGEATCLGHCYRGGAYRIGDHCLDAGADPDSEQGAGTIPFHCHTPSSMFGDNGDEAEVLYQRISQTASSTPVLLLYELSISGLRGRGGAGFPFTNKLAACRSAPVRQKYVVCNGDEGDPGAFSDRWLLEERPQRVLAGMLAAGLAMGSNMGFLYVRAEYPLAQRRVAEAIETFEQTPAFVQAGFRFHLVRGAGAYICGEETALLNSIEGLRPEVRTRPPYPAQAGLFERPTLVSNVETFAALPWILENGGAAFAALGTEASTGTKLVSLDQGFNNPGVHEVTMGTALEGVIYNYGGGFRRAVKAVQVGGPLGSVVPVEKITRLSLDFESFAGEGFLLGHAGIVSIPQDFPMIEFLRHLFTFMADESCGKCLPCRLGTEKGRRMLLAATVDSPIDSIAFDDLLETLELGSLCGLGGGLPLPVRNILSHFRSELADYFSLEGDHE
ncbi:MAG: formate dehydrogenase [Gammaproteobacteria bacterium]|nr:formate dehydrogenase [Gammaproteobacteria bacterium]